MPISSSPPKSFINGKHFHLLKKNTAKIDRLWCTKCGKEVLIPDDHICSADSTRQKRHPVN